MFSWTALTSVGVFDSSRHSFSVVPHQHLKVFLLEGYGHRVRVDMITGAFEIDGVQVHDSEINQARMSQRAPYRLVYRQDAEMFMDVLTMETTERRICAGLCGWEADSHRVYWRVEVATGKVFRHIETVSSQPVIACPS